MNATTRKFKLSYPFTLYVLLFMYEGYQITTSACNITTPPAVWYRTDYPNPRVDTGRCGRNCTVSWVCDPSNILTQTEADDLDSILDSFYTSGHCPCPDCPPQKGYEVYIALMVKLKVDSLLSTAESVSRFADHLRTTWASRSCGNIVVILISRDDMQLVTSAGPAASSALSQECIQTVYNEVRPLFKARKYFTVLTKTLQRYNEIFSARGCSIQSETTSEENSGTGLSAGIIAVIVVSSITGLLLILALIFRGRLCKIGSILSCYSRILEHFE